LFVGSIKKPPPTPVHAALPVALLGSQFGTAHGLTFATYIGGPVVPDGLYASAVALTVVVPGKIPQIRPKNVGSPDRWTVTVN